MINILPREGVKTGADESPSQKSNRRSKFDFCSPFLLMSFKALFELLDLATWLLALTCSSAELDSSLEDSDSSDEDASELTLFLKKKHEFYDIKGVNQPMNAH